MGRTPVVASRCSAVPGVVPHGQAGLLFEKDNVSEMAKCLVELLKDDQLRKKMGDFGYTHVKQHFNWQTSANNLIELYEKLL